MFPFFFGDPDQPLYGVYHMPEPVGASSVGVVLCQPILHEYTDARRALRALAERLARAGHHVLRFDYHGTGDSAGAGEAGDVERWCADIDTAVDELKASRGLDEVGLVGLRFGATMAAQVAARREDVPFLVLWEPIVKGPDYVQRLRRLHATWLDYESRQRPEAKQHVSDTELLGHAFSAQLEQGLVAADLTQLTFPASRRILFLDEGVSDGLGALERQLHALGPMVEERRFDGGQVWSREIDGEQAPVPREIVTSIVDWISGSAPDE